MNPAYILDTENMEEEFLEISDEENRNVLEPRQERESDELSLPESGM